jgi:hypothetical protein
MLPTPYRQAAPRFTVPRARQPVQDRSGEDHEDIVPPVAIRAPELDPTTSWLERKGPEAMVVLAVFIATMAVLTMKMK